MILLDASIIIDGIRAKELQLLEQMVQLSGAVCGVTRAEILSGTRVKKDHQKLLTILDGFQQVLIPESLWDAVGETQAHLRSKGLTVPMADAILATISIRLDIEVWARDSHFPAMKKLLPALKLYEEAPN